jgi:flagellum-specific ATP synthase
LPKLLERAGAGEVGSITGLYTVLVDGDDMNEPIADTTRSILDGHIVLSRRLATSSHFPSIEVLDSVSRVENMITSPAQRALSAEMRRLLAAYRDARDLIEIGAYVPGTNPLVDRAVRLREDFDAFLQQPKDQIVSLDDSWRRLGDVLTEPTPSAAEPVLVAL